MDEQTYINGIKNRSDNDYPAVVQVSDPLLVRVSKTSLLLNDTTFYAKIKKGLAFNGYVIYSSGIGTPIIEVDIGSTPETTSNGTVTTKTENDVDIAEIEQAASDFLDKLEARIATSEFQNPIKASIDRLCWQIHYDITKSKTNFVTAFEDQGFSKSVESVDGWSSSSTTDGATFYDYFGYVTSGSSNLGLIGATKQIATSLRADDSEYTISKALRDVDDDTNVKCVAWSVKEQTDLERVQFLDISENRLGSFGTSMNEDPTTHQPLYTHRSLFDTLNYGAPNEGYSNTDNKSLAMTVGTDVIGSGGTYNKTIIAYDDEISNTKLGKFGIDGFRNLFLTLNDEYSDGNNTTYNGYSNTNFDSLYKAVGDSHSSTIQTPSYKDAIYSKIGTASDSVSDTLFGLSNNIKKKSDSLSYAVLGGTDYTSAPTDNIYTALLDPGNGAIQKCSGYLYADSNTVATFIQDGSGNPKQYQGHYYIATESSRFALMYNLSYPQFKGYNTIKSQESANPVPW